MPDPNDPLTEESITNDERASWAEVALLAYGQRTGVAGEQVGDDGDQFLIVSDLLADLGHWCDRHDVNMRSALAHAAKHYHAETGGAGRQFSS